MVSVREPITALSCELQVEIGKRAVQAGIEVIELASRLSDGLRTFRSGILEAEYDARGKNDPHTL